MAEKVTTSITVSLGGDAEKGHLSAEIDSRELGLNGGQTTFSAGSTVGILIYKSANVTLGTIECSFGTMTPHATATTSIEQSEDISFTKSKTASLGKPNSNGQFLTSGWSGGCLPPSTTVALSPLTATTVSETELTATLPIGSTYTSVLGVYKVKYNTTALQYTFDPGAVNTAASVIIYIPGEVV